MRRLVLMFGMLLTLTAGVWGSALAAAASAWCTHEATATADAPAEEHDCCRAKIGEANAHRHSGSQQTSHDAAHENHDASREKSDTRAQPGESHAGMNCGGAAEASPTSESVGASLGARGSSCAPCCAGGSGKTPATAVFVAPEQNKVKRAVGGACCAGASRLFAPVALDVSHLAPTQHAPPPTPGRRHVLLGVFLI